MSETAPLPRGLALLAQVLLTAGAILNVVAGTFLLMWVASEMLWSEPGESASAWPAILGVAFFAGAVLGLRAAEWVKQGKTGLIGGLLPPNPVILLGALTAWWSARRRRA